MPKFSADRTQLRVLSTLALAKAMDELVAEFTRQTGTAVDADFAPTNALLDRVRSGETADLAILTAQGVDQLIDEGVLLPGSRSDIALSAVGIAVRAGAPKPDIASVAAFTSALLAARSVAYSRIGASGVYFADLIARLGIAGQVNAKARIIPQGFTAELVANGEAELAVQQISELLMVPGIEVVGALPREIGSVTTFSSGVFGRSAQRDGAMDFAAMLASGKSASALRMSGLDPVAGALGS